MIQSPVSNKQLKCKLSLRGQWCMTIITIILHHNKVQNMWYCSLKLLKQLVCCNSLRKQTWNDTCWYVHIGRFTERNHASYQCFVSVGTNLLQGQALTYTIVWISSHLRMQFTAVWLLLRSRYLINLGETRITLLHWHTTIHQSGGKTSTAVWAYICEVKSSRKRVINAAL